MIMTKLIERDILELGTIITVNSFQAVGMLIVKPQSQALKSAQTLHPYFPKINPRVMRIVIHDDKNVPLASYGAKPRGTDSVHME
jgi:hypothetical protein